MKFRDYVGHGIGRQMHEDPPVPNFGRPGRGPRLVRGMCLAVEPMINAGGWAWNLYNQPGPYDEIAHFYTIFAITLAAGFMLYDELMENFYNHRVLFVITIASLGIALGALWEVAEWLSDFATPKQIVSGLFDTITDIILDSGGALLAALLNLWGLHERARAQDSQKGQQPVSTKIQHGEEVSAAR